MTKIICFDPLREIMTRGIAKYTDEVRGVLIDNGEDVYTLQMPKYIGRTPKYFQIVCFMFYQQIVLPFFVLCMKPSVVFDAYNSYSILSAIQCRYIYVIHDFIPYENKFWRLKPGAVYQRILFRMSGLFKRLELYYINHDVADQGLSLNKKYDGVIPNIVRPLRSLNSNDFDAVKKVKSLMVENPDYLVISTISGAGKNKDFTGLVNCLKSTHNKVLLIAFGFDRNPCIVEDGSVKIYYPGLVSSEYIGTAISLSKLFVFHSASEGFGRPVIEALIENVQVVCVSHVPVVKAVPFDMKNNLHTYDSSEDFNRVFAKALKSESKVVAKDFSNYQADRVYQIVVRP